MSTKTTLYEQDFYAWTQEQAALLEGRQFDALDIPHLVEEITSLGKSEQRELVHRLEPLLEHLVKLTIAAERLPHDLQRAGRLWRMTVKTQRVKVAQVLRDNPSVRPTVPQAIADAYAAGYLGRNILRTGYSLHLHLHISAGRYICGEETALLNALEGKRATPRAKPPFPQVSGLWGKPTIVNNVETLCNVPHIIKHGAAWFKGLSQSDDGGTKIYGVSGRVQRPGAWELPMGTPMRTILEEYAGGMRPGYTFRGVLPGGASTDFLVAEHLDVPMDFNAVQQAGSRLGTGTMIVLDDHTCPVAMVQNLEHFFAQESCGWCTPCRDGLPWTARLLQAIEAGQGRPEDLELLTMHTKFLTLGNTFCALAPGAVEPLQSALRYFRDDFEQHIRDHRCPWR
jgi:NADH-quinone oxidoreductase subunit F